LRDSGNQVTRIGVELSGLAQQTVTAQPQENALRALDAGEMATREIAARLQHHLKQVQAMEQLMGRINQMLLQGKSALEQAMASAKEVAAKGALFTETAQQTNQLSMKAAFEVVAVSNGKGGKQSGTVIMEIRKLVERGRIFADEIGELSLGMTYMVENAHALLGNMAAALQESVALTQGMALADAAHHGQMVQIHSMTQTLKGEIQGHTLALRQLTPLARSLAQQVVVLQKELAFFSPDKGAANLAIANEEERLARESSKATDELVWQEEEENP
jgi:methyl-accepting chemotaxis protein